MFRRTLLTLVSIVFILPLTAQEKGGAKLLRKEIELNWRSNQHYVAPVDENGVLLFSETNKDHDWGERVWSFSLYGKGLEKKWSRDIALDKNVSFKDYVHDGDKVSFFYYEGGDEKYKEIAFVQLDLDDRSIDMVHKDLPDKLIPKLTHFAASGTQMHLFGTTTPSFLQLCGQYCLTYSCVAPIFGVSAIKLTSLGIHVNMENKQTNVTPFEKNKGSVSAASLEAHSDDTVDYIYNHVTDVDERSAYLKTVNSDGKTLSELEIKTREKTIINNGNGLYDKERNKKIVIGTYIEEEEIGFFQKLFGRISGTHQFTGTPSGLYFTSFKGGTEQEFIKYLEWGEIESMNESAWDVQTYVLNDLFKTRGQYVFMLEGADPYYETYTTYDASTGTWETERVLAGYHMKDVLFVAFDQNGELQWDHYVDTYTNYVDGKVPKAVVRYRVNENGNVLLTYSGDRKIASKTVTPDEVLDDGSRLNVQDLTEEEVKRDYETKIAHWYGNYYVVHGSQKLDKKEGWGNRKVFYFTKIYYDK